MTRAQDQSVVLADAKSAPLVELADAWFKVVKYGELRELGKEKDLATEEIPENTIHYQRFELPVDPVGDDQDDSDRPVLPLFALRFPKPFAKAFRLDAPYGADILFVSQDDLDLFKAARSARNCVIKGNAGVGKSWFHVRYILFCTRPLFYKELSGEETFPPGHVLQSEEVRTFPPKAIFRMYGPSDALKEPSNLVFDIEEGRAFPVSEYTRAATATGVLLYEPGLTQDAPKFPWQFYDAVKIMTVSPLLQRYEEWRKQVSADVFICPCPFRSVLSEMARVVRPMISDDLLLNKEYAPEVVEQRIRQQGPFIRYVLAKGVDRIKKVSNLIREDVRNLDISTFADVRRTIERGKDGTTSRMHVSHRILKYQLPRNERGRVPSFYDDDATLVESTEAIPKLLKDRFLQESKEDLRDECIELSNKIDRVGENTAEGKAAGAVLALKYEALIQQLLQQGEDLPSYFFWPGEANPEQARDERPLRVKDQRFRTSFPVVTETVTFAEMEEGVLYAPSDPKYPFVDFMWRDGNKLICIQVTKGTGHAKKISTFKVKFLKDKLNIDLDKADVEINIFYAVRPGIFAKYKQTGVQSSFVFLNLKEEGNELLDTIRAKGNVEFGFARPRREFWSVAGITL